MDGSTFLYCATTVPPSRDTDETTNIFMRKQLFSFFLLLAAGVAAVHAQAFDFSAVAPTGQTLYYKINSDSTTVKVVRPSNNWSGYTKPTGNLEIPSIVVDSTDTTTYVVRTVGDSAFSYCGSLTNVTIGDSITVIKTYAFYYASQMTSVTLGSSLTRIEVDAFCGSGLTSVTIPEKVTYIGEYAFWHTNITTVNFNARNCTHCGRAYGTPITYVGAFGSQSYSNNVLTTLNIGESVTKIPSYAFLWCRALTDVVIPDSVISIGSRAFYACNSLSSVSIGNSVTTINEYAFHGCPLSNLNLGNAVTTIGACAFQDCRSLDSLVIPNSVTTIGNSAFSSCGNLVSVILPNSISEIPNSLFSCCHKLRSIVIPDSVTSIGGSAFYQCDSLKSVVIGASVTSIGAYAFHGCYTMERMTVLRSSAPSTSTDITNPSFGNGTNMVPRGIPVYVPCNSLSSYTSASGWNVFTNLQEPPDCSSHYWDFHQTTTSGSSVYYKILDDSVSVAVVHPLASDSIDGTYWHSYRRTVGTLEIPDTVVHDSVAYVVRVIGSHAFEGCTGLRSITIPVTVDSIGNSAFAGCVGIHTVNYYADSCRYMGEADSLVFGGANIGTLNIGNMVRGIPDYAFEHQIRLQTIHIPDSVVSVGDWAFAYDANVTDLTLGASLSHIGVGAFYGCGRLRHVDVVVPPSTPPSSGGTSGGWTWIGGGAFGGCSFGSFTYGGTTISPGLFSGNTSLDTVYISDTVTTIGDSAFNGCTGLTTVVEEGYTGIPEAWIPRTVRNVGNVAFGNCVALTRVRYDADSCLRMGCDTLSVFMNDSNIAELVIGEYVRWIPDHAFLGCTGLESITATSLEAPLLGVDVFSDVADSIPVYIPCGSLASYTLRWSHFSNFIEGQMEDTIVVQTADSAMGSAVVSTLPTCANGRMAVVEATAYYGYHFSVWSDGVTDNPRSLLVTRDTVLTALFERNEYMLTVVCDSLHGTVTGAGVYLFGDTAMVTAVANEGFVFSHWEETADTLPTLEVVVLSDIVLTARFDTVFHTLTVVSNNPDWGSVSGGGVYAYGSEVEISAVANEGYRFVQWSDGVTENVRVIVLVEDLELTAEFEEGVGIEDVDCDGVTVYPNPTCGVLYIDGEDVVSVDVYDIGSRRVVSAENVKSVDLSALPAGMYYIRVVHSHGVSINKVVKK